LIFHTELPSPLSLSLSRAFHGFSIIYFDRVEKETSGRSCPIHAACVRLIEFTIYDWEPLVKRSCIVKGEKERERERERGGGERKGERHP
jgi:hypothetical protein